MTRARDQPSQRMINRLFQHQAVVPAENVGRENIPMVEVFYAQAGIEWRDKQAHRLRKDDREYIVHCFADSQHAKSFAAVFGGEVKETTV